MDYTGFCYYSQIELSKWENWYNKKKGEIKENDIKEALSILKKSLLEDDDIKFLKALYVKYNN